MVSGFPTSERKYLSHKRVKWCVSRLKWMSESYSSECHLLFEERRENYFNAVFSWIRGNMAHLLTLGNCITGMEGKRYRPAG